MSKNTYLPNTDSDRVLWLNNFAAKFTPLAVTLGFVAADATAVTNDATMFAYLMGQVETFTTAKEQRVQYKNLIKDGPLGKPGGTLPAGPAVAAPPTIVAPGIFPRIAQMVQRIKNHPTYTEAIGADLGIIGAEQVLDDSTMKPELKLKIKGGQVVVHWVKGKADAVRIESNKGSGWQFLAVDSVPHYQDNTPITTGTWQYRAMYIIADELVGQMSDVVTINV
jgi:hypothetical protein